jgi:hypothetical protein
MRHVREKSGVHRLLIWTPEANIPVEKLRHMWEKDIKMVLIAEELETGAGMMS